MNSKIEVHTLKEKLIEMKPANRIQILDKAVSILLHIYALEKGMNPYLFSSTGFFSFDKTNSLGVGKLTSNNQYF